MVEPADGYLVQLRRVRLHNIESAIRRARIDDDDLILEAGLLLEDGVQYLAQVPLAVEREEHHGCQGSGTFHPLA